MNQYVLDASEDQAVIHLGDAAEETVGTIVLELTPADGYNGTLQIEGRIAHFDKIVPNRAWYPIPYTQRVVDGVASDGTMVSGTLTPSGPTLVSIDATGIAVRITQAADPSPAGTVTVRHRAVKG